MLALPIFLILLAWTLFICLKWKKNIFDYLEKLPGLKWYPIFGTYYVYSSVSRADILYKFAEVTMKFKPLYRSWNGNIPEVHLLKPEHLQVVMRSSAHTTKGPFYQFLFPWLGEGLFISEGLKWFLQRKLLTPTFHFKILESFVEVFGEKASRLLKNLESKADGKYFNIVPDIATCTLGVICEAAMGIPLDAITKKPLDYVHNVYEITELAMWRFWRPHIIDPLFYLLPQGRRYKSAVKELHAFSSKVINYRKELSRIPTNNQNDKILEEDDEDIKKERVSFMDLLLDAKDNKHLVSDSDLQSLVDTFLAAGYETTANSICWSLFLLGNHPDIQEKAFEEVQRVLKDRESPSSIAQVNELKYVECVAKEALRLYPVFPFLTRTLTEDIKLDDCKIPARTQAILHLFLLHRDPELYPDPNKFDPDRFLPENSKARHPYAYIPFSAGPRNCLGMRFALLELKSILATIIKRYKVTALETPEELKLFAHILIRSQTGIRVKLEVRQT